MEREERERRRERGRRIDENFIDENPLVLCGSSCAYSTSNAKRMQVGRRTKKRGIHEAIGEEGNNNNKI